MLLFSTLMDINDSLTQDDFIKLVIEWNKGTGHDVNAIPGLEWDGRRTVSYSTEMLRLDIQEYRNKNIIAVRYQKTDENSTIWDTCYVMNFDERKMSVRLERTYAEDAIISDSNFSAPRFIRFLIDGGYVKNDKNLQVSYKPHYIDAYNTDVIIGVVNGRDKYQIPVVYVSKTFTNETPVDVEELAKKLKGVAHVLVQEEVGTTDIIRKTCESKNVYDGGVGIYYPNQAVKTIKYMYRQGVANGTFVREQVIKSVLQYSNARVLDKLYTWQGVTNALLVDRLESQREKRSKAEEESQRVFGELYSLESNMNEERKSILNKELQAVENELREFREVHAESISEYQKRQADLENEIERLEKMNEGLKSKIDSIGIKPVIYSGTEPETYPGEIKEVVLAGLEQYLSKHVESETRRYDVVKDIIEANC